MATVDVLTSEVVVPAGETPAGAVWLSNLDLAARRGYTPTVFFYRHNGEPGFFAADAMRDSLARALVAFYPVAGRLGLDGDGRVQVDCTGEGAVFATARSGHYALDDLMGEFVPCDEMRDLFVPPGRRRRAARAAARCCWCSARAARGRCRRRSETRLHSMIDTRQRLSPPLPPGYFGNAVIRTSTAATAGEVVSSPVGHAARRARAATSQGEDYARSVVDYLEGVDAMNLPRSGVSRADLRAISWLGMSLADADFGWGSPAFMGPAIMYYSGFVYVMNAPGKDGAVALALSLEPESMPEFRKVFADEVARLA
uniref:Uncharacterized protein n=1 Tax=Oryza barthii TaxID=65489 RepID=A0A0D3GDL5_9ORYZ